MAEPTSAADNQILKPHSNAIVPHKIANHDTEAVQLNVWNGTEWVNIYDGNDMRNMNIDLHKVSKVVEKHAAEIPDPLVPYLEVDRLIVPLNKLKAP